MTPAELTTAQMESESGLPSMQRAAASYMGSGQANEEKFFNKIPGEKP